MVQLNNSAKFAMYKMLPVSNRNTVLDKTLDFLKQKDEAMRPVLLFFCLVGTLNRTAFEPPQGDDSRTCQHDHNQQSKTNKCIHGANLLMQSLF
jgi:hypothetical protein